MTQQIRQKFTPQEKVAILRQHLLEGKPVSDDCDSHAASVGLPVASTELKSRMGKQE